MISFLRVSEESSKNRSEKRASNDRFHANLVKWQGYPLQQPLLKLPMDLNALALECFECILRYCGDMPQDRDFTEVKSVYTVLMVRGEIEMGEKFSHINLPQLPALS